MTAVRSGRAPTALGGLAVIAMFVWAVPDGHAQQATASGRSAAPIDITGNWVSLITDEWSIRMLTPSRGDYRYIPLNETGRELADQWDAAGDEAAGLACQGYAAPAIMRMPSRLRVGWQDDMTLRIEIDTGTQTRLFSFDASAVPGLPTWQGHSVAEWQSVDGSDEEATNSPPAGTLRVDTTNLRPGYLQKNGVPFSAETFMTEYFNILKTDDGREYLIVQIFVEDPVYLAAHWVRTATYRRASVEEVWNPTPCTVR